MLYEGPKIVVLDPGIKLLRTTIIKRPPTQTRLRLTHISGLFGLTGSVSPINSFMGGGGGGGVGGVVRYAGVDPQNGDGTILLKKTENPRLTSNDPDDR
jgi:hypothetical protein